MIVNDPVWNIIWLSYPIHVAPLKQRLFVRLIQKTNPYFENIIEI